MDGKAVEMPYQTSKKTPSHQSGEEKGSKAGDLVTILGSTLKRRTSTSCGSQRRGSKKMEGGPKKDVLSFKLGPSTNLRQGRAMGVARRTSKLRQHEGGQSLLKLEAASADVVSGENHRFLYRGGKTFSVPKKARSPGPLPKGISAERPVKGRETAKKN